MQGISQREIDQCVFDLYDEYCHGDLAEHDERVNGTYPAFEAGLKAAGVAYQVFVYPGTRHGFHNDSTPRYDEAAAKLSWSRTVEHFRKHLV